MSVSPHDRVSAIFTTVASAVCCAPESPRSAKFNSRRDNPRRNSHRACPRARAADFPMSKCDRYRPGSDAYSDGQLPFEGASNKSLKPTPPAVGLRGGLAQPLSRRA